MTVENYFLPAKGESAKLSIWHSVDSSQFFPLHSHSLQTRIQNIFSTKDGSLRFESLVLALFLMACDTHVEQLVTLVTLDKFIIVSTCEKNEDEKSGRESKIYSHFQDFVFATRRDSFSVWTPVHGENLVRVTGQIEDNLLVYDVKNFERRISRSGNQKPRV